MDLENDNKGSTPKTLAVSARNGHTNVRGIQKGQSVISRGQVRSLNFRANETSSLLGLG